MNDSKFKEKVMFNLGHIKATITEVKDDVKRINSDLANIKKDVARHNIILGKIGVGIGIIVFAITASVNFIFDWLKNKF